MSSSEDIIVTGYAGVTVGAVITGSLQWLVLRRQIAGSGWWVLASIAAAAVVGVVAFGVGAVHPPAGWVAGVGLFGTVVGVLQWLVLRQLRARAGWWVFASTAGWLAGGPGVGFVTWLVDGPLGSFLAWPTLGIVYGVVTGAALVWLWRQGPPGYDQHRGPQLSQEL
jgi:hypothetical protein